jgi:plastocyanin
MKRMTLLLICGLTLIGTVLMASSVRADERRGANNATVSFGQWIADPNTPLDRLNANPPGGTLNNHELIPNVVRIRAGGSVNFIISGLHNVQVYNDGTRPEDIKISPPDPLPGVAGGIIDDPDNRIYRGWDPNPIPNNFQRDRVEVVQFTEPGTYLVICGVVNHFLNDNMFGFVVVRKANKDRDEEEDEDD